MRLSAEQQNGAIMSTAHPGALMFEQHQQPGKQTGAPSPFDDGMVPELDAFQSRASMAAAVEELSFHNGIGNIMPAAGKKKPPPVAGFATMLQSTAAPASLTKSMTILSPPQQAAAAAAATATATATGFDSLDSLGLLDGLLSPRASAGSIGNPPHSAAPMSAGGIPTPAAFAGELSKFFGGNTVSAGGPKVDMIAEVPQAGSNPGTPVMDFDAHMTPLATPVLTAAPTDAPFGDGMAVEQAQTAATSCRRSSRAPKKQQPFDNSANTSSGGAAKSGKGRRANAAEAARGTAGKNAGGKSSTSARSGSGAGKKPAAAISRPVRVAGKKGNPLVVNQPAFVNKDPNPNAVSLANLDATGALPEDHKPARGRGRQIQLAKMTPEQKKAEAKARLEKNRQAARGFRARRKNHVFDLEQQIAAFEQRDQEQVAAIAELKLQIQQMQKVIQGN